MKVKKLKKMTLLFIFTFSLFSAKINANTNFGYTSGQLLWTSHTPVRYASNVIPFDGKVYYVGNNHKVHEYYWNNGTWTGGWQLEWGGSYVRTNTQIINYNHDIFYVNHADKRVYKLSWNSSTGWSASVINASSVPVRDGTDMVVYNNYIYYVGTNNKICYYKTNDNGVTWTGGVQLISTYTTDVKNNTQIIPKPNKIYYIGTTNLVCEYFWNGSSWVGGQQLDWSGNANSYVKSGTELCVSDNYGIYHISANDNKIYNLNWTPTSGWTTNYTQCSVIPKTNINMKTIDNHLFFVGDTDNKIYDIEVNGSSYTNSLLHSSMPTVNNLSQLHITYNDIYITGTNNTFKSYQITYLDAAKRINYLIYDYLFDPSSQTFSTNPMWHHGKLNANASAVRYYSSITNYNKQFYFVSTGGNVHTFLRSVVNANTKPGYTLTWDQNFDAPDPNLINLKANWNSQLPHGSGPRKIEDCKPTACQISYSKYFDNCVLNNGVLSLVNKNENYNAIEWGEYQDSSGGWFWLNHSAPFTTTTYNYTHANIHTGMQNKRGIIDSPPNPFAYPYPNGGAEAPQNVTFSQLYGWFEIRCRIPRGKNLWSAFWMLLDNGPIPPEIDIFEIGGDGGSMKCSDYIDYDGGVIHFDEIAVGYRFYDEYYTYALEWTPTHLKFYLNNELVFTESRSGWVPQNDMFLIIGSGVDNVKANSELSIYPNSMDVDYVRAFSNNALRVVSDDQKNYEKQQEFIIFPNPNNGVFNIKVNDIKKGLLIQVYDLVGKEVFSSKMKNTKQQIDISNQPKGIYLVKVTIGDKVYNEKIVYQ